MTDAFLSTAVCSRLNAKYTNWANGLTKEQCRQLLAAVNTISKVYAAAKKQSKASQNLNQALPGAGKVRAEVSLYSLSRLPGKKKYVGICPYNFELPVRRWTAFSSLFREELLNSPENLKWATDMSALWFERLLWDVGEFAVRTVYGRERASDFPAMLPVVDKNNHCMLLRSAVHVIHEIYRGCREVEERACQ